MIWDSSNVDLLNPFLTNGDLLKLMPVSRSVYTSLAKVEARAFAEFESSHAGSDLEKAMWNWRKENVKPSRTSDVFPIRAQPGPLNACERSAGAIFFKKRRK